MTKPPPLPTGSANSWWDRNWKWFSALLGVAGVAVVLGFLALLSGLFRSTDVYREAMARVNADPIVSERLGAPIEDGLFATGRITTRGDSSGTANMEIRLQGVKETAVLYVDATKSDGQWEFSQLVVQIDRTHERVDLLASKDPVRPPTAAAREKQRP